MNEFDVIIKSSKKYNIPTAIPESLKILDDTDFKEAMKSYYSKTLNNICLRDDIYNRLKNRKLNWTDLETIYNEMWHAFYDQVIEEGTWINEIIEKEEKRYPVDGIISYLKERDNRMVDEAISETFNSIAGEFARYSKFEDNLNLSYNYKRNAKTPMHNFQGEKWHKVKLAQLKMSKEMYYTTLYVFYNC